MVGRLLSLVLAAVLAAAVADAAEPPPFDLAGPDLRVSVTHAGVTLPISQAPNLSEGDELSIRADLPDDQSAHYLLVAAFLRGATNPPPKDWFFKAETWTRKGRDGLRIRVPAGAEQALVFLAPQAGGGFGTLVGAVRGRPGAFVRASQDLDEASLDRSRIDAFLAAVRVDGSVDPERLKTVSPLLARSLALKLNADCFQRAPELQAACLMQGQDALVLSDGHSASIVEALTSGPAPDLAFQLSASPAGGFGYASPYVGAVIDIARILDSFRVAQFQYIPALGRPHGDRLSLLLNAPPSFHNPLSVLVAALPAVAPPQLPPLREVDPKDRFCAGRAALVLPVEGAPLVYSTRYAHDLVLRTTGADGKSVDTPVQADAEKGGLVVAAAAGVSAPEGGEGSLHGLWGFAPFDGPTFHLQSARADAWRLAEDSRQALVAGRDDAVRLEGAGAACVDGVSFRSASDPPRPVDWKPAEGALDVTVPLGDARPGPAALLVSVHGRDAPDVVPVQVLTQAARLDALTLHAGDAAASLTGARLDEVAGLSLAGVDFAPGDLASANGADVLALAAADTAAAGRLAAGQSAVAKVTLKDGRTLRIRSTVAAPRPQVSLIAASQAPAAVGPLKLAGASDIPRGSRLTFSLRAEAPTRFSGAESVEVAGPQGALANLTLADGLTQADPQVLVATLDTGKAFGPSVFGPLRARLVQDGAAGDWRPLGTLVRLPVLRDLKCPPAGRTCELSGDSLFLIEAVSSEPDFKSAAVTAPGYTARSLQVPHPHAGGRLYVRLHDDPASVAELSF